MSITAAPWPGIIEAYRDLLSIADDAPVVTLLEGNTPLLDAPGLARRAGVARVL
ncbi:MAG: threonine synthase, partial [Acidimicrobiia bacterium]